MNCFNKHKIISVENCVKTRKRFTRNQRVGIAHGCFDVLTPSHVRFLFDAAHLCDQLIVSVSTDEVAKRLKGEGRPTFALEDRMMHIAAFECVDYVVPCAEDNAAKLIEELSPVLLLKGHDSVESTAPGFVLERAAASKNGGAVIYVVAGAQSHTSELLECLGRTCLQSSSVE